LSLVTGEVVTAPVELSLVTGEVVTPTTASFVASLGLLVNPTLSPTTRDTNETVKTPITIFLLFSIYFAKY